MWLIVTQGNPEQKRKAKWLSIFLECWYDVADLKNLAAEHIGNLRDKKIGFDKALVFTKAFSQSKYITTTQRDELLDLTIALQPKESNFSLLALPKKYNELANEIIQLVEEKKFTEAHTIVADIENEEDGVKFCIEGVIFQQEQKFSEAEKYYLLAIKKGYLKALNNFAILYYDQQKFSEAEKYYLLAIEKRNAEALINLANLCYNQHKLSEAKKYYLLAIEKGNIDGLYNLAILYKDQQKFAEAERYWLLAIEKGHVFALNNLAILYKDQQKFAEAEKYYLLAIEKGNVNALNNWAILYYKRNMEKPASLELISTFNNMVKGDIRGITNQILIETWNGIFENLHDKIMALLKESKYDNLDWFFEQLLIQEQLSLVFDLFTDAVHGPELQKRYTPLYYAVLLLNNKTENNLTLRIPPEIMPTVNEVIEAVKERQQFYKS